MKSPASTPQQADVPSTTPSFLGPLLRGETDVLARWMTKPASAWHSSVLLVILGAGLYGGAIGLWRSPLQAVFSAIKLPLILLLTATGNAFLNAVLAPLLGLPITLRQSLRCVLAGFAISAVFLGSIAPIVAFETWSLPALGDDFGSNSHGFYLLQTTQVAAIAIAGFAGNARLFQLLCHLAGNRETARRVLAAWLLGNFLLGTQVGWILRPYFGAPSLPVEFLRPHPLQSNFFEAIGAAIRHLLGLA